jgi:O-antigen/teichoic acid export membrane protein
MNTARRVSKNFASLTLAEILTRVCAVLLLIYVVRVLGVTALGELAFATAVIGFLTFFADFGLTTLGIREIARKKQSTDSYGTNILLFQSIFTLFLIFILGVSLVFLPISHAIKIITLFYGLGLIPLALDMSYIFQAHQAMQYILIGKVVNQGTYLVLGVTLITLFRNVVFVPIAALIGGIAGAATTYLILGNVLHFRLTRPDTRTFKMLILAAVPFVASEILITIYRSVDTVMLQFFRNTSEVGYYSSGYKVVNSIIMFISLVPVAFFPLISHNFKHDKGQFQRNILLVAQTIGIVSIPLAIGGIIYARKILVLLYGGQIVPGVDAFKVLLPLVIVIPLKLIFISIVITADRQKHYMISGAIGAAINVVLNVLLIPKYGMAGAGISILATETIAGIYLVINCTSLLNYVGDIFRRYFLKPLIAVVLMGIVAVAVSNAVAGVSLAVLVYVACLYALRGIPEDVVGGVLGVFKPARTGWREEENAPVG